MKHFQSYVKIGNHVNFPAHTNEKIYMKKFTIGKPLPKELERWQETVDQMTKDVKLEGYINPDRCAYLMVDQAELKEGEYHRRPGIHIDGYWVENLEAHGGDSNSGRWAPSQGHKPAQEWPSSHRHGPSKKKKMSWQDSWFFEPEAIILASNVSASTGQVGRFYGDIGEGGDCSKCDLSNTLKVVMEPFRAYQGTVTFLHETIPVPYDCKRTVVRINVPGWHPQ